MPYFRVSSGQDLPGQTRIREKSQLRIMQEEARLQEEAEERQYERALEERERQRGFAEEERKRQQISAEQAKQAEQKSSLRKLEDTSIATKTGTLSDTGGYRPTTGRIQSEQVYGSMPTAQKIEYLTGRVRTAVQDEPSRRLREDIEAYGGTAPPDMSMAGLTRLRDIQKEEATELEKERREKAASHRKALDMIKFTESRVVDPKVDNVMHRGDPDKEYTLDTFTEAKRNIEGLLGRTLSAEEEKPLRAIPYPEDGVDEYLENLKEAEERKLEYEKKLAEVKRAPGKEKDTQFQQTQQAKKNALEGYINMGYFPGEDGDIPLKTQQDVFSVAIGMGLDIGNPEIKAWILELPLGTEEIDKPGVFSGTYKKALPSPYKKYKKGTIIKKLNKTWKYLGKGKWEEQ